MLFSVTDSVSSLGGVNQYNIIFHVVVLCWCVDSLVCRLHNYSKKLIFKEFVH